MFFKNRIFSILTAFCLLFALTISVPAVSQNKEVKNQTESGLKVKTGEKAPAFTAKMDNGKTVSLADFKGKQNVILYFYPKDDTPGCTKEACSFQDNLETISSSGTAVLGVSVDDFESHGKFKEKYGLEFNLISDTDKKIVNLFGVARESRSGTVYANRVTLLIDKKGVIRHIWPKVKVKVTGHTEEVLAKIEELGMK